MDPRHKFMKAFRTTNKSKITLQNGPTIPLHSAFMSRQGDAQSLFSAYILSQILHKIHRCFFLFHSALYLNWLHLLLPLGPYHHQSKTHQRHQDDLHFEVTEKLVNRSVHFSPFPCIALHLLLELNNKQMLALHLSSHRNKCRIKHCYQRRDC